MLRYCTQCGKARKACICCWIEELDNHVELVVLQHSSEQKQPLGTARILSLSLSRCDILVGENFTHDSSLNDWLNNESYQYYILYPSETAYTFEHVKNNVQKGQNIRIILLDGTWKKAYKIWQLSTNLHDIPCVSLPTNLKGAYTIRKAPTDNALSTVEAGYHLLNQLEPEKDFTSLLTAFNNMIQFQIDRMPEGVFEAHYLKNNK
ncbi:DTW domain-containing protein [Vibrio sp.]|nr:DTW domain-containing protein [Vibrio sp.]